MLTYLGCEQRALRRVLVIPGPGAARSAERPPEHHRTTTDTAADQAPCRYRADVLYPRRYRRHQEGPPCRRGAEQRGRPNQGEACCTPSIRS